MVRTYILQLSQASTRMCGNCSATYTVSRQQGALRAGVETRDLPSRSGQSGRRSFCEQGQECGQPRQNIDGIKRDRAGTIGAELPARQSGAHVALDFGGEDFLELRKPRIKTQNLRGEGMSGSEILRAANPRVVLGCYSLCGFHFRRGADPINSLYQAGGKRFAKSSVTSP